MKQIVLCELALPHAVIAYTDEWEEAVWEWGV